MLAPHAAATPGPATTIAAAPGPATTIAVPRAATLVGQRTGTAGRTRRQPGRRLAPRRGHVPGNRIGGPVGGITAAVLRREVINAVNAGTHGLDAGNKLLASLNQKPLKGGRQVAFRVDAGVRAPYDGLAAMIGHARAVIDDELRQMRWTRLDGGPEGYGIDEPAVEARSGALYGTVHTTLRLTVTVLAYQDPELEATASRLLHLDLGRLRRVEPARTRISLWDEDGVTSWDGYLVDADADDDGWPAVLG